jgi:hypothetical protein
MSGYIGPLPVPQGIQRKQSFTATASQTTFNTNGYTDGDFINVYLNGVRLINGTDYTATNGSDIVLTTGASASDVLDFETFQTFQLVDQQFENVTLKNPTHEDTDGGRESAVSFKGEQTGGEISTLAQIQASHDGTSDDQKGDLIFKTNDGSDNDAPTEAMRIDSSRNVLIGKTAVGSTAGIEFRGSSGYSSITRDGNNVLTVRRLTDDGDIVQFESDSTVVGSIGVRNGDFIYIANADSDGFALQDNAFRPSSATGSNQDDVINVGTTASRFKDLYLSGGVYLGGTGSANYLEDYEEGTYTVTATPSSSGSLTVDSNFDRYSYTKIGRLVTVTGSIDISGTSSPVGYIKINLPFTGATGGKNDRRASGDVTVYNIGSGNVADFLILYVQGESHFRIYLGDTTSIQGDSAQQMNGTTVIACTFSYLTS